MTVAHHSMWYLLIRISVKPFIAVIYFIFYNILHVYTYITCIPYIIYYAYSSFLCTFWWINFCTYFCEAIYCCYLFNLFCRYAISIGLNARPMPSCCVCPHAWLCVCYIRACSLDYAKKSFFRSLNAIFGKIGRNASEEVILELIRSKCIPILI